jgi:thiol-disulfide isomerase/thioredoxin
MRDPLLALTLIAAAGGVMWVWLRLRQRRAARAAASDLVAAYGVGPDGALIMAFSTSDCAPCKTVQRPALEALQQRFSGRVVVGEIDATQAHDLTARFGIVTVPSTVVIGPAGDVRAINNGAATEERLRAQIGLDSGHD